MREELPVEIERGRVIFGQFATTPDKDGPQGLFLIKAPNGVELQILASNGMGWDHVSVALMHSGKHNRVPTWGEMCFVKDAWWDETETVVQFHPAKKFYKNLHPYVLHLWKKQGEDFPLPDKRMV